MPRHKLTEEERKRGNQFVAGEMAVENAKKGAEGKKRNTPVRKSMAQLANLIASAPISSQKTKSQLKKIGVENADDLTNQAVVVAAVYMAAASGDMKAVEKWQELTETLSGPKDTVEDDALSKSLKELGEGLESDD